MELETNLKKRQLWLLALTILLVKFSVIFLITSNLEARESFEFNLGQKINVLSDKAFRKTKENEFEAVGNVVITHLKNSIYGEKAKLNFNTGETLIEGNVRYIAPGFTLYGTKLAYNFISREINLTNARIISDTYSIVGKKIIQQNSNEIIAEEAEYTTCKDCPESWSIYGKKIHVTIGKYVRINHAFIKVNGVIAMYVPYIVFPIKQNRETGLLFPSLSYKNDEGLKFQQPFFWAISDHNDATISPSVFGNRGPGGEFQYRQYFGEKTWLQLNALALNDQMYVPYKISKEKSGSKTFRQFSDLELHQTYKENINSHFYYNKSSDLDTDRDFYFFSGNKILGTELGGGGFLDFRTSSYLNLTVESYFNQNILISDPKKFDDQYVQILPKVSLNSVPVNLIHSNWPFLKNISIGEELDFTIFKQNHPTNLGYIRNADRLNFIPYVEWQLGNLGPVFFTHTLKWDFQNYHFPYEKEKSFLKRGFVYETEAKFELDRIFGISYIEETPLSVKESDQKIDPSIIGTLPSNNNLLVQQFESTQINSYRHAQEIKFKHYYLSDQQFSGNRSFYNQILNDSGQFDYLDALRSKEHSTSSLTAQDTLPLSNTVEFQWNNSLIRKKSKKFNPYIDGKYLKDNFEYSNVTFFNVSQGYDFNLKSDTFSDHLTRLYLNTGFNFDQATFSLQEFYFHRTSEHETSALINYNFVHSKIGGKFTYNSFNSSTTPVTKLVNVNGELYLNDLLTLTSNLDYDLQKKWFSKSFYSVIYSPLNKCWKIELNYAKDLIEKKVGFIFYMNYNENNFASINVH